LMEDFNEQTSTEELPTIEYNEDKEQMPKVEFVELGLVQNLDRLMEDFNEQTPTTELVTAEYNEDEEQTPTAEYNDDDIDIAEFFEESFQYNEDINASNIDVEQISLKEGDFFTDFDEAELRIQQFAEYKGFKIRHGCVMIINTAENEKTTQKRTILCKHSCIFKPKNIRKASTSARLLCPWHINLSCPSKDNPNFHDIVTTFNNIHNHELSPEAINFERRNDLQMKCDKKLNFLSQNCRNAETPEVFEFYWRQLISFSSVKSYLVHRLYERRYSWASAFNTITFTLNIQSISEEEKKIKQFEEWKYGIPSTTTALTISLQSNH
ncbi:23124_t:CDS:2, partial [Gigaspora rosea]